MVGCAMPLPHPELLLRFDRPFAVGLVHRPSGAALFVGEVHRPQAWADPAPGPRWPAFPFQEGPPAVVPGA